MLNICETKSRNYTFRNTLIQWFKSSYHFYYHRLGITRRINSSRLSVANMCQKTRPRLFQIMACRLSAPSHYQVKYLMIATMRTGLTGKLLYLVLPLIYKKAWYERLSLVILSNPHLNYTEHILKYHSGIHIYIIGHKISHRFLTIKKHVFYQIVWYVMCGTQETFLEAPRGRFKKTYELLNLRALKISPVNKIHIFQCMGKIFCVEFQRVPLKFHTKYLTHTLKDMIFMQFWNFKSS